MLKKDKQKLFNEIEKHARPVELGNHILLEDILSILKGIELELKKLNKDRD